MKKQKPLFKPVLADAVLLAWRHKAWWLMGFLALFLSGTMGYQILFEGIRSLARPEQMWVRWQAWSQGLSPIEFIGAQGKVLFSDPKGWFVMLFVWLMILATLLILLIICSYATAALISVVKIKQIEQSEKHLFLALREAIVHVRSVVAAVLLVQLLATLLSVLLSIPVVWLGIGGLSLLKSGLLFFCLGVFLFLGFILSSIGLYSILHIVYEDLSLSAAIVASWKLFWRHWLLTLEMFVLQSLIGVVLLAAVFLVVSLIIIPITIIGYILVANQLFDITTYLPQATFYLILLLSLGVASIYTVFYLYSWTLLFSRFEEVKPHSRFAKYLEVQLMKQ